MILKTDCFRSGHVEVKFYPKTLPVLLKLVWQINNPTLFDFTDIYHNQRICFSAQQIRNNNNNNYDLFYKVRIYNQSS